MRRTAGITHITLFTEPAACGGSCLFCPRVPDTPHSYLPHSHVSRAGLTYDARDQARHWLDAVERSGRTAAKLEVIILGGSFSAHAITYQHEFLAGIYRAVESLPHGDRTPLEELVARHAASARHRIIGITVECRPDQVTDELCRRLFAFGVTKIEMGVQSLDDAVLALNDRGHDAAEVARATAVIRAAGLKIGYHLMLGLPGATEDSDRRSAEITFTDPAFQPDHLKIYFCEMFRKEFMRPRLVDLYETGAWKPLGRNERDSRLAALLPRVPAFMRISRIGRKFAPDEVADRSVRLDRSMVERRHGCACIRCREPGPREVFRPGDVILEETRLGGDERFLEARIAGRRTCLGLLRLRLGRDEAIVRELHVYGFESAPGDTGPHQHRGIGKRLVERAEWTAREAGLPDLSVASGVGVRGYYGKLGYALDTSSRMRRALS